MSCSLLAYAAGKAPVRIGIDGEFGLDNSTSAQAVELGLRTAIAEINANGGVLHGRPPELVIKNHHSMPARGIRNIAEFAAMPDIVAVFGARFSPVVIEELPTLKQTRLPFMAVWSSADAIVDNGMQPNYLFRLSLRDSLAMPKMLSTAAQRGLDKVGLLLTNTAWGRSNLAAAQKYMQSENTPKIVRTAWYNWKDTSLIDKYETLRKSVAHAYDMMHILARAIDLAGSADRSAVRDALEKVPDYRGLVKHYHPPFTAVRHEALGPEQLLMARYRTDGVLVPSKD